jgi:hypothetical protein
LLKRPQIPRNWELVGLLESDEQVMIDNGAMKRGKYRAEETA